MGVPRRGSEMTRRLPSGVLVLAAALASWPAAAALALSGTTAVLDEARVVRVGQLEALSSRRDLPFAGQILDALG